MTIIKQKFFFELTLKKKNFLFFKYYTLKKKDQL
jgi:hypothetical protein